MSYMEVFNYSDPDLSSCKEHSLSSADDFDNFLLRKGVFSPRELSDDTYLTSGVRFLLQLHVKDPQAFAPDTISLSQQNYETMVREMRLPLREIETSSAVGPFFWWKCDGVPTDGTFQMVFRKSDVRWQGRSRGWEMMLSYCFRTKMTFGYVKATDGASPEKVLSSLKACAQPASHPFLLPLLVLNQELSSSNEKTQRECRDTLRQLETVLSKRYPMQPAVGYSPMTEVELDKINRQLAECQCQVLWKRPQAWKNAITRVDGAAKAFWRHLPEENKTPDLEEMHLSILDRLDYLSIKLENLESYIYTTLERLNLQRHVMDSIISQRESRFSLTVAVQQSRLATLSMREGESMKTLTLLGSFFLPGTFLSSIFSMSFFEFKPEKGVISSQIWIYIVITIPFTAGILGLWWMLVKNSSNAAEFDAMEMENDMRKMEGQILHTLRRRTGISIQTGDPERGLDTSARLAHVETSL